MKKKVAILVFSNLKHDGRVKRHIDFLLTKYSVTAICFDAEPTDRYEIIKLTPSTLSKASKLLAALFLSLRVHTLAARILFPFSAVAYALRQKGLNLIIANDVETLPLAFQIANSSINVLLDAHEYSPRQFEDRPIWRFLFQPFNTFLCNTYLPRISGIITVGKGLAREYEKNFSVKPVIVTNAANHSTINSSETLHNRIRLIHHGIYNTSRNIELMLELIQKLDSRFTLDLMLVVPETASAKTRISYQQLEQTCKATGRIRVIPGVERKAVIPFINQYDMGVFFLPPVNFNYANTLPNKLFDFIQAKLAIAIGPTPEMAEIVNQYKIGIVSDDFSVNNLAKKMNTLTTDQINQFKQNTLSAANDLNAEKNQSIYLKVVNELV